MANITHFVAEIHDVLQRYVAVHVVCRIVIWPHSRTIEAATPIQLAVTSYWKTLLAFHEKIIDFEIKFKTKLFLCTVIASTRDISKSYSKNYVW